MAHYEHSLLEEQIVTHPYTYQFGHYLIQFIQMRIMKQSIGL